MKLFVVVIMILSFIDLVASIHRRPYIDSSLVNYQKKFSNELRYTLMLENLGITEKSNFGDTKKLIEDNLKNKIIVNQAMQRKKVCLEELKSKACLKELQTKYKGSVLSYIHNDSILKPDMFKAGAAAYPVSLLNTKKNKELTKYEDIIVNSQDINFEEFIDLQSKITIDLNQLIFNLSLRDFDLICYDRDCYSFEKKDPRRDFIEKYAYLGIYKKPIDDFGILLLDDRRENEHFILWLLTLGADINKQNKNGESLLHIVLHEKKRYQKYFSSLNKTLSGIHIYYEKYNNIATFLIEHGANLDMQDKNGKAPLHLTAFFGDDSIAEKLINKAACLNLIDKNGQTPLHIVLNEKNDSLARLLIENNALLYIQNQAGETPLHRALYNKNYSIAKLLIEYNAPLDRQDTNGQTPLHIAVFYGYQDIIEDLIKKDVDINLKTKTDKTPLKIAQLCKRQSIIDLLIEHHACED